MIRTLRARHRVLMAIVGLLAGILGLAGLLARRTVPDVVLPAPIVEDAVPILEPVSPP
jgi:hypothetical protein